jgi:hypothetical protein
MLHVCVIDRLVGEDCGAAGSGVNPYKPKITGVYAL